MSSFDRVGIFFDRLKPLHKQSAAVCVVVLLVVIVVVLSAAQSRLTGRPPGSITLAWDPSPSNSCLAKFGYNLYRTEKSGSYSAEPVNKELIKEPTYTDTSVLAGKTYYYVVKAKCGNTESEPSNEMKVDVPDKGRKGKQ